MYYDGRERGRLNRSAVTGSPRDPSLVQWEFLKLPPDLVNNIWLQGLYLSAIRMCVSFHMGGEKYKQASLSLRRRDLCY